MNTPKAQLIPIISTAQLRAFTTVYTQVLVGDSMNFESVASNEGSHSIEVKAPGQKTFVPVIKKIGQETLGVSIKFDQSGRYSIRSVCIDPTTTVKAVSRWVEVDAVIVLERDGNSRSVGDLTYTVFYKKSK